MSDIEIIRNEYNAIKKITDFYFDLTIGRNGLRYLKTYQKWRDRETIAFNIYVVHVNGQK